MNGFPRGTVEYAAFMDAEPADAAEVSELADWLFGRGQFPKLDGVDMELLGCEVREYEYLPSIPVHVPQSSSILMQCLSSSSHHSIRMAQAK